MAGRFLAQADLGDAAEIGVAEDRHLRVVDDRRREQSADVAHRRNGEGAATQVLPPRLAGAGAQRSPKILIVEDEALIRLSLAEHLRDRGFDVLEAGSGDCAKDLLLGESGIRPSFVRGDLFVFLCQSEAEKAVSGAIGDLIGCLKIFLVSIS